MAQQMDPSYYANLPASPPPPGVIPNLDHPQSRAIDAHIGMGICIGITSVLVVLRVYVKLAVTHMWGWDDWACLTGFTLIVAHDAVSFTLMGPGGGLGTHIWDIRVSRFTKGYFQNTLATINLYAASAFFVKLSLFILYLRLFKPNKVTRWLVYGGIVACGSFYSASIISNCALCLPKPGQTDDAAAWTLSFAKCGRPSEYLAICQGVFGTLSDIYLIVIPIGSVFQLHLPLERKVGVSAVFMIGIIAITCSIGSLGYRAKLLSINDDTWFSISVYIFSAAEISAGIICSCMPILPVLFNSHTPKESRFPFLRYLSLRSSSNSRRPFTSNETSSLKNLYPNKRDGSSGYETDDHMGLESGTVPVGSKKSVLMERDY